MDAIFQGFYDIAFGWDIATEVRVAEAVWRSLSPEMPHRVVEVGAGTGRYIRYFAREGKQCLAIEPDDAMRSIMESHLGEMAGNVEVCPSPAEAIDPDSFGKYDSCILMTDAVSYITPLDNLTRALVGVRGLLEDQGTLVIHAALWQPFEVKRFEEWTQDGIRATCSARITGSDARQREEVLKFTDLASGVCAPRRSTLHAFTFSELVGLVESLGFEYHVAVADSADVVAPGHEPLYKTLTLGFRR